MISLERTNSNSLCYPQYDGQTLVCEYRVGAQVYSEDIKANIYLLDLPTSPVLVADVVEGEAATLSVTAGLYPKPERVVWTIRSLTGAVETVLPGGKTDSYQAANLQLEVGRCLSDNSRQKKEFGKKN